MYDGSGKVDCRFEAAVGLVSAHGDALELLELAEEILDQAAPFVGQRRSVGVRYGVDAGQSPAWRRASHSAN